MNKDPASPRPLLDRALERLEAAALELSKILHQVEVLPEIPSRRERRPATRRRDGLNTFHPDRRGVVALIPGSAPRLIPPEDPMLHQRWHQARQEITTWCSVVEQVAEDTPPKLRDGLSTAVKSLERWSLLGSEEPPTIPIGLPRENAAEVCRLFGEIADLLGRFRRASPPPRFMRVLDTSALMECTKPRAYGQGEFEFIIPRTVLAELDRLKHHENLKKRNRAQDVGRQLREWKRRGSLMDGVTEDRTITIRVLGKEPDMVDAPPDLQSSDDDRIIWTARELTFRNPWCTVILVSGDFNLCARAEFEHVQTEPSPE